MYFKGQKARAKNDIVCIQARSKTDERKSGLCLSQGSEGWNLSRSVDLAFQLVDAFYTKTTKTASKFGGWQRGPEDVVDQGIMKQPKVFVDVKYSVFETRAGASCHQDQGRVDGKFQCTKRFV